MVSLYGVVCSGPFLLVLDYAAFGPFVSLRNTVCPGLASSAYGMTSLGSLPFVLDYVHMGFVMFLQGFS